MALTNEEIDERFEVDDEHVIRWRKVNARGLPRWCQVKADEINRKAGEAVNFFRHSSGRQVVKIYDCHVTDTRILKVLLNQTAKDVAVTRERSARKRAKIEKVERARASAKPTSAGAKAWSDPLDPMPAMGDKAAMVEWELREFERVKAWMRENGNG